MKEHVHFGIHINDIYKDSKEICALYHHHLENEFKFILTEDISNINKICYEHYRDECNLGKTQWID